MRPARLNTALDVRMNTRVVEATGLLAAIVLLSYSVVIILRVSSGGTGRVGGDVIAIAYCLLGVIVAANVLGFTLGKNGQTAERRLFGGAVGLLSVLIWLGIHFTGVVFSHESLFSR